MDRIYYKTEYDFYWFVASFRTETDWKTFYDMLVSLPDEAEELEELKQETKRRLNHEQTTDEYVEKIMGYVLSLTFICTPILFKINHHLSHYYFSHHVPRYIEDPTSYLFMVEEIRAIRYRIQLYCFFRFVKELSQEVDQCVNEDASSMRICIHSILSATELCLKESINRDFWEHAFNTHIDSMIPLFSEMEQNHSNLFVKFQSFFILRKA